MANEAFALSPISARAAEPNEQDYEAIREAFMETARGRWFLGEYAKRNRNADTGMVLDAVARIEEALAAQRQPVVEDRLPEVLAAIRRAVGEAETAIGAAFDRTAIETSLGPINRAVRIVREISWRWREIGADGRICDLIDAQLTAIESASEQISRIDPRAELNAAFDLLKDRLDHAGAEDRAGAQAAAPAAVQPSPAAEPQAPASAEASAEDNQTTAVGERPHERPGVAAGGAVAPPESEAVDATATIAAAEVTEAAASSDVTAGAETTELAEPAESRELDGGSAAGIAADEMTEAPAPDAAADAEDEAVLDIVAMEMAALDPEDDEPMAEPVAAAVLLEEPIAAGSIVPAAEASSTIEAGVAVLEAPAPQRTEAAEPPIPSPPPEASLGSTILASGMLQMPRTAAGDPLAPIRRMTQAEKIAFFS